MLELTHRVSRRDWYRAEHEWNALFNVDGLYYPNNFERFIGLQDFRYEVGTNYILCTEAAFRKIEMLSSPHAYALMKAFIARTSYHKKLVKR